MAPSRKKPRVYNKRHGGSLIGDYARGSILGKIYSAVFDPNSMTASTKKALATMGDEQITAINIMRDPIESGINNALQYLSFGKWNQLKEKYGYDKFFHLYVVITLQDGSNWIVQKNANIDVAPWDNHKPGGRMAAPLRPGLTLNRMFKETEAKMGKDKFYQYDAFSNNCQDFVMGLLSANGCMNQQCALFVKQDIEQLAKEMPAFTKAIARMATDAGHAVGAGRSGIVRRERDPNNSGFEMTKAMERYQKKLNPDFVPTSHAMGCMPSPADLGFVPTAHLMGSGRKYHKRGFRD